MDDALYDVGQRLDALAADDERAYQHAVTHTTSSSLRRQATARSLSENEDSVVHSVQRPGPYRPHGRQKRSVFALSSLVGLSGFYIRVTLAIHAGWCLMSYTLAASSILSLHESVLATLVTTASVWSDHSGSASASASASDSGVEASVPWNQLLATMQWPWTRLARTFGATAVGAALGSALFGSLADHFGRRRVLVVATVLWLVAHIAVAFSPMPSTTLSSSPSSSSSSSKPSYEYAFTLVLLGRGLEGMGFGGQLVLFHLLPAELAAQRQRGRLVTLSLAGIVVGTLTAAFTTVPLIRVLGGGPCEFNTVILTALAVLFLLALICLVRESPRFLAASGRTEAALREVEAIEHAHGVQRYALSPHQFPPGSGSHQIRAQGALAPRFVSLGTSLGRRWVRVLCRPPYRSRSLGLALFWFLTPAVVVLAMAATVRFSYVDGRVVLASTLSAGIISFVATAAFVDRRGRVPIVAGALVVTALGVVLSALHLQLFLNHLPSKDPTHHAPGPEDRPRHEAAQLMSAQTQSSDALVATMCVLLSGGMTSVTTTGAVWTVEHYGVMIRATGVGHAMATGWLGMASALWLAWSTSNPPPLLGAAVAQPPAYAWLALDLSAGGAVVAMWVGAGLLLVLAGLTWLRGFETRGRDDCDMVISGEDYNHGHDMTAMEKLYEEQQRQFAGVRVVVSDADGQDSRPIHVGGGSARSLCMSSQDSDRGGQSMTTSEAHSSRCKAVVLLEDEAHSTTSDRDQTSTSTSSPACSPLACKHYQHMTADQRAAARIATRDMLTIETDPFEGVHGYGFVLVESPASPTLLG